MEKNNQFRTSIGGQALIEGILMRGPEKQAIVVRSPEGLVTRVEELTLVKDKYPILGWPIIRGAVTFLDSMVRGVKALMFSADYYPDDENTQPSKLDQWLEAHVPAEKLQSALVWVSVLLSLGLTLLLDHWFSISPSVSGAILNVLCYAMGWKLLGRRFLAYSFISTASFSLSYKLYEQFPPLFPEIANHPLLAALVGAVFVGVGAGVCVRAGGAPGGDDALAMSVSHVTGWGVERVYLLSDLVVLLLSLTYIPARRIGFSLLTVILSGQIIGLIQKIPHKKEADKPAQTA